MAICRCNKLSSGQLEYDIDTDSRKLRLVSDIQGSGDKGANFSDEWIDFDIINNILIKVGNTLTKSSMDLQPCFNIPSSNNGPMLAAVLIDLNVIDNKYNVLSLL